MMNTLEPSYLRYIYDGLEKGDLHPDNAAALPEGLIGLYEEAFDESKPVQERQKILKTFAIWALLKKEVSAQFVADILEVHTREIMDFIASYSNWFTSPESGKYKLYHDRLKVYILQKLNSENIQYLNNIIINKIIYYIKSKDLNEHQHYGLKYLGYHLLIETSENKSFEDFINLCLDINFIEKQIAVSNIFDWSKEPIKEALKLAAFHKNKKVVFELITSIVNLTSRENNNLNHIFDLIDSGNIDLVIIRLNSILDGTKENYTTSYIFHILSLLFLFEKKKSRKLSDIVKRLIENVENTVLINKDIINHFLLIPENITIKLALDLNDIGIPDNFMLKASSDINFSTENLIGFNRRQFKILHLLVKKHLKENELDFLICAAKCLKIQNNKSRYFQKEIQFLLEKKHKLNQSYNLKTSYEYEGNELIPENILELSENRLLINYCCENYLKYNTNNLSLKVYKSKFNIENKDVVAFFPFPNIELTCLFNKNELEILSNSLFNLFKIGIDTLENNHNKSVQKKIILSLINYHNCKLINLEKILIKYGLYDDLSFYIDIVQPHKFINFDWQFNYDKLFKSKIRKDTIVLCQNILKRFNQSSNFKENIGGSHIDYILMDSFLTMSKISNSKLIESNIVNRINLNLSKISSIDTKSQINFESIYLVQFAFFKNFPQEFILNLINNITNTNSKIIILKFLVCYYFSINKIENANIYFKILINIEHDTKASSIILDFNNYLLVKNLSFDEKQIEFLLKLLCSKAFDSDEQRFEEFKLLVKLFSKIKSDNTPNALLIKKTVDEKLNKFNTYLWKNLAIKFYSEEIKQDVIGVINLFQKFRIKKIKITNDEVNVFKSNHKLIPINSFQLKSNKRKIAFRSIKNSLNDYFFSNKLYIEPIFSETELISFAESNITKENIKIFVSLVPLFKDTYNKLAFINELIFFINSNSLDKSEFNFDFEENKISVEIALKAIKSFEHKNQELKIINDCIKDVDKIEDDDIDFETGEIIDGNEEKVKSLYFIISNLWKIGEKKRSRKQLKIAFNYLNKMEYEIEKKIWAKKLNHLAIFILDVKELELYINDKIKYNESLSNELIDSIFKNNFTKIISIIFLKDYIEKPMMRSMVSSFVKYNSLEEGFRFAKTLKNHSHSITWKNFVIEKTLTLGNDFNGSVKLDNYDLVFHSFESSNILEQMLKYELFNDLNSNVSSTQVDKKFSGYLLENEFDELATLFYND
jgi:hypothetical protein